MSKRDPFEVWRDQKLGTTPAPDTTPDPDPAWLELSPARHAVRALVIDRFVAAQDDQTEFDRLGQELIDLNRRLYLEQIAEDATDASSHQARIAVLQIAAILIDELADTLPTTGPVSVLPDVAIAVLNAAARQLEPA